MRKRRSSALGTEHLKFAQKRMKLSSFSALLGFEVKSLHKGRAKLAMTVRDRHRQIHSVVHGGVTAALADTAGAIAAYTVVAPGVELVTIELKINYLLPIAKGKVEAEGKVLRAGRNFVVVECDVTSQTGELAAKALMTFGAAGLPATVGAGESSLQGKPDAIKKAGRQKKSSITPIPRRLLRLPYTRT